MDPEDLEITRAGRDFKGGERRVMLALLLENVAARDAE